MPSGQESQLLFNGPVQLAQFLSQASHLLFFKFSNFPTGHSATHYVPSRNLFPVQLKQLFSAPPLQVKHYEWQPSHLLLAAFGHLFDEQV